MRASSGLRTRGRKKADVRSSSRRSSGKAGEARRTALARFAIAGALGRARDAARAAREARRLGVTRRAIEETALMLVLYAGFPAALETLRELNQAWPGRARRTREGTLRFWRARGMDLSRRVYGPAHRRLLDAVRSLHPDLAAWMVETGYGRVLSRAGLAVGAREAITVAVLAATGRERQLVSHLLGARRVGVSGAELVRVLRGAVPRGAARATARRAWRRAFGARVDRARGAP